MKKGKKRKDNYSPVVEAILDLHGYRAERARIEVADFLDNATKQGMCRIRIIVGKGNRSVGGVAILPDIIKGFLNENGYIYTYSKIQDGGEGALEVTL